MPKLGAQEALGAREPVFVKWGKGNGIPVVIHFDVHMAFKSGVNEPGPGRSREGIGIKGCSLCRRDSGEVIVIHTMVLVRDVTGSQVEYTPDSSGVARRNADVKPAAGPRFPFRDLLAILEHGIKDIDRAAPDMGALQVRVRIEFGTGEQFDWSKARAGAGHVVPEVNRLVEGKRP
jgi:hypothetical protein